MAQETGDTAAAGQLEFLFEHAPRASFFQAVLALERLLPGAIAVGYEGPAERERLRIRPSLSLSCPPADLESIKPTGEQRVQITTTFLGLYGVDSPLPSYYAEHLAQISEEQRGRRLRAFYDLFHHRLYSLLFRAWRRSRATAIRPIDAGTSLIDPAYTRLLSFVGYVGQLDPDGAALPRLFEARIRVLRARTAAGLEMMLRHRLGYRCVVDQLQRRVVDVPRDQLTVLGRNASLGIRALVGARITDHNKICVTIDASSFTMFERLLPEGLERRQLDDVIAGYLREPIDHDIEVSLDSEHVPPWRLGELGVLARTAWLGRPSPRAVCRWRVQRSPVASRTSE